jgi:hypothetical protein
MEPQKTTSLLGCPIDHQGAEHSGREVDLDRRTGARLCFAHATVLYVNTEFASISPWIKSAWDIRTPCSFRSGTISEYKQTLYQPSFVRSRGASMLKIITSDKNSYPTLIRTQGEEGEMMGVGLGRGVVRM